MSRAPMSAAEAAANVRQSVWVTAHAGTGKTYVLVTRFVALLLAGVPPQKILCLTYMRAAAAEMRQRVLEVLAAWQQLDGAPLADALQARLKRPPAPEEMQRARTLYVQALETPGGMNIQTIHAFCQRLLQRFALESGTGGRFRLLDDAETRTLQTSMRARFIRAHAAEPAFQALSRLLNEQQFADLTDAWHSHRALVLAASEPAALAQLSAKLAAPDRASAEDAALAAECAALSEALLHCGRAWLHEFAAFKQRRGILDYEDLIARARHLLCDAEAAAWVQFKLDGGLEHVLLDEAQDTTAPQWEIVQALTAEFFAGIGRRGETPALKPSLFVVGDDKQAILNFQGADPGKFRHMRAHFVAQSRDFVRGQLSQSHRTLPAVLQAVDDIFAAGAARTSLMPEDTAALQHATVRLDAESNRRFGPGYVELWGVHRAQKQSRGTDVPHRMPDEAAPAPRPLHALAAQLADKVQALVQTGEAAPHEILILVRSRNALMEEIARALRARTLPLMGVDRMQLHEAVAVMDVCAAARAALLPQDGLMLAHFLRSPLGGVSEDELLALCQARGRTSLWAALEASAEPAAKAAAARLSWCAAQVARLAPYEFFARLLTEQGGMQLLQARLGPDCADPLQELLAAALQYERAHAPSMLGFLHWLEQSQPEITRNAESEGREIRLMTVHAAKGLEAKCVFLPQTCNRPGQHRAPLWLSNERDALAWRLTTAEMKEAEPPAWYRELVAQADAREREAHARLLYVALTRARDQLYIGGYLPLGHRKVPPDSWYDWIHRGLVGAPYSEELSADAKLPPDRVVRRLGRRAPPSRARPAAAPVRLPAWARKPAPAAALPSPPVAWRAVSQLEASAAPPEDADMLRLQRGRHMHFLLEHLPRVPRPARTKRGAAWLAQRMPQAQAAARDQALREVLAVLDAPRLQVFFSAAARHEVPLMGKVACGAHTLPLSGRLDVMVEEADRVLVADFKTGSPPPNAEAVAPFVLRQMAGYRAFVRAQWPDKKVECWLVWTAAARGMHLPDALLDAAWQALAQERT